MGGSRKKRKVGNRYEVGFALVACRQADALLAIRANDEVTLWEGKKGQGRGSIKKLEAFGGDEREGGFAGYFDVELGGNDQPVNSYLSSVLGPLASAMRGVVSIVYRRPYVSANTARLPALSQKWLNVVGIHRGWLPALCIVGSTVKVRDSSIYIALDMSLSMSEQSIASQSAAVAAYVRALKGATNSVRVVTHAATVISSIERIDCTAQDYEDIATFIEALTINDRQFGGDWDAAVTGVSDFFDRAESVNRDFLDGLIDPEILTGLGVTEGVAQGDRGRLVVFTTDGQPTAGAAQAASDRLSAIENIEISVFNIDDPDISQSQILDNTDRDSVPVVSSGDPSELLAALSQQFTSWADLNPAHLIRCLLTDPMRGGTVKEEDIGDSFEAAALTFFSRGFGLSPKFRGIDLVIADRQEIERHADCVSFYSAITGKWELKIIEEDYIFGDLPVLNSDIVVDWSGLSRPEPGETANQLTVKYTNRKNGDVASITRSSPAAVRRDGRVIPAEPANYPSITSEELAIRVCLRDLKPISKRLWNGSLELTHLPANVEPGSRVVLNEPALRIFNVVATVTEIRHGDSTDARAWLTVSEDKYASPSKIPQTDLSVNQDIEVLPVDRRVVAEASYYSGVIFAGQEEIDQQLASDPDLGRLLVTGAAPNGSHIDFSIGIDAGAGVEDAGVSDFEPYGVLVAELKAEADQTQITVSPNSTLGEIAVGSMARIGEEIIRIDDLTTSGENVVVTVGRGCLDTTPKAHSIGDVFIVTQDAEPLSTDYLSGQSIGVRLVPRTSKNKLSVATAPEDQITFGSRAVRPYPPGQFQINGSYEQFKFYSDIILTWSHRDRTLQTTPNIEDHTFGDIGPEPGTTYRLVVDALDQSGNIISNLFNQNLGLVKTYDWDDATVFPNETAVLIFRLFSVRDGYDSFQASEIRVLTVDLQPPQNLTARNMVPEPPRELTATQLV